MHTWAAEQVGIFLASVREICHPAWLLLATLGMRRGELLGLRWVDVDLTSGRIAIRHLVMVDGKPATAEPKTAKGRRSLTLAPEVRTRCGSPRPAGGRAAVLGRPTPTRAWSSLPRTVGHSIRRRSGLFVREAKQLGLPPIRLHDLRHSVASILLARGVHPKVVSEMLGHATIALTLDTYSHVIPSLQQEAAGVAAVLALP